MFLDTLGIDPWALIPQLSCCGLQAYRPPFHVLYVTGRSRLFPQEFLIDSHNVMTLSGSTLAYVLFHKDPMCERVKLGAWFFLCKGRGCKLGGRKVVPVC